MNDDREPGDGDLVEGDDKLPVPDHVQEAVRTLLAWAGEDPSRAGLLDTPARVGRAWKEYCRGYEEDTSAHLSRTFREVRSAERRVGHGWCSPCSFRWASEI